MLIGISSSGFGIKLVSSTWMPRACNAALNFSASARQVLPRKPEKSVLVVPSALTVSLISRIRHPLDHHFAVLAVNCLRLIAKALQRLHTRKSNIHLHNLLLHLVKQFTDRPWITDESQLTIWRDFNAKSSVKLLGVNGQAC